MAVMRHLDQKQLGEQSLSVSQVLGLMVVYHSIWLLGNHVLRFFWETCGVCTVTLQTSAFLTSAFLPSAFDPWYWAFFFSFFVCFVMFDR